MPTSAAPGCWSTSSRAVLPSRRSDFNADLCRWGAAALRERVGRQLVPEDRARFVPAVRELAQLPA